MEADSMLLADSKSFAEFEQIGESARPHCVFSVHRIYVEFFATSRFALASKDLIEFGIWH